MVEQDGGWLSTPVSRLSAALLVRAIEDAIKPPLFGNWRTPEAKQTEYNRLLSEARYYLHRTDDLIFSPLWCLANLTPYPEEARRKILVFLEGADDEFMERMLDGRPGRKKNCS